MLWKVWNDICVNSVVCVNCGNCVILTVRIKGIELKEINDKARTCLVLWVWRRLSASRCNCIRREGLLSRIPTELLNCISVDIRWCQIRLQYGKNTICSRFNRVTRPKITIPELGAKTIYSPMHSSWDEKIRIVGRVLHESATAVKLFPCDRQPWEAGIEIHIKQWGLLQSTLLRELWILRDTPAKPCFTDTRRFLWPLMPSVLSPASTSGFERGIETWCNVYSC